MAGTLHKGCCVLLRVTSGGTRCPSLMMLTFDAGCHREEAHVVGTGNLHQGGHRSAGNWA